MTADERRALAARRRRDASRLPLELRKDIADRGAMTVEAYDASRPSKFQRRYYEVCGVPMWCTYDVLDRAKSDARVAEWLWPAKYRSWYRRVTGRHLDLSPAFAHTVSLLAWENSAHRLYFAGNVVITNLSRDTPAMLASKQNRDKSFGGTNFSLKVFKKILREKMMKDDAVLSNFLQQGVVTSVARRFPAKSQQELEDNPYETWVLWLQSEGQELDLDQVDVVYTLPNGSPLPMAKVDDK